MAKLNDETVVHWLVNEANMSDDKAWSAVMKMLEREQADKEPKAPRARKEWLVVVADPNGVLKDNLMGFVVQKSAIRKDLDLNDSEEERMWGDQEAEDILERAFKDTYKDVKGLHTFAACLRVAKKTLKDEYGFEIKTKEGCYIAPIRYTVPDEDLTEEDEIL